MSTAAIILSGGVGSRMKMDIPKQYLEIQGHTLLYYTIKAFAESKVDKIIVVCGSGYEGFVSEIIRETKTNKPTEITVGGGERYDSVYNGLLCCQDFDYVLIHDGARCLISAKLINKMVDIVNIGKNCIAAVSVNDTIKLADEKGMVIKTLPRKQLYSVQTPQAFSVKSITDAHSKFREALSLKLKESRGVTDDAMIIERFSDEKVFLVEGEDTNIKITTPADLEIADRIIKPKEL